MRIDDPGQRRLIRLRADIGVGGPDQLVAGDALAGRGHACQSEIGRIGQDGCEQRVLVVAGLAGAQVGECGGEAGSAADFMQQFGDPYARQHCVDAVGQCFGFRRRGRLHRGDMQAPVAQLDPFELTAPQPAGEAFQPPVEFGASRGQPFVRRCGQAQLGRDRRHRRGRQQVAVEPAIVGRSLDPDVAGAQLVAQRGKHGSFVEPPVSPAGLGNQPLPFLSERHRRVGGTSRLPAWLRSRSRRIAESVGSLRARRLEFQCLKELGSEFAQRPVAVGGTVQRVFVGEIGEFSDFALSAKQLRPADGFVDDGEGVAFAVLGVASASIVSWNSRIRRPTFRVPAT